MCKFPDVVLCLAVSNYIFLYLLRPFATISLIVQKHDDLMSNEFNYVEGGVLGLT
jgi:hypothetical protein